MNVEWLTKQRALPIIFVGCVLLAVLVVKLQPAMQHEPTAGLVTPVNVITITQYLVKPAITGFGVVEPDILLEAKSEIAGKIVYVHPQLRNGTVFPKDTVVIRIEQDDFQLTLKQAEADTSSSQAKLREIKTKLTNTRVDLKLAKQKLVVANKDLERGKMLLEKNFVSEFAVDSQQSNVIKLQQEVQNLNTLLKTLPEQQASLEASLSSAKAGTQSQQRNLDKTTIRVPFNARISQLVVKENQFVSQGALLFSAQTTDKILINAQFSLEQFRTIAKDFGESTELIRQAFQSGFSDNLFTQLGLSAKVRLADDNSADWQAKVERISSRLDPVTRTLGVIISVDRPNEQIEPGIKPPLLEGMYTEISIEGKPKAFYLVPRDALHEGELFLVNSSLQLERRVLKPDQLQGNMALFSTGLEAGEQLIVSDLFPAISGMALKPIKDQAIQEQIAQWAKHRQHAQQSPE
jgi:multidrug efflux pump subunit AcrA (membrane-fusion protein)